MTSVVHQPPPVQFQPVLMPSSRQVPAQDPKMRRQKYTNVLYGLGLAELVMGIIFVLLGFISLGLSFNSYGRNGSRISPGVWCSAPLIACGVIGMYAKKNSSTCVYNANMVLSIISALMMGVLFVFSVVFALSWRAEMVALWSILAAGSFSAMVVNIVHSAYCCAGVCCARNYYPGQVMYIPAQQPSQQYIQLANGQYMMVQAAPSAAGYPLQNAPLQAPYQPATYVHLPPAQGPISQRSNGNEYRALAQQEQVSTDPPASQVPKFPVTFDE